MTIAALTAQYEPNGSWHIDREKWEPCKICGIRGMTEALILKRERLCAHCGRPLTEEAWAELERRCLG